MQSPSPGDNRSSEPRHFARVTDIGEYIRHQSCQRRFKLGYNNQSLYKELPFSDRPFHTIDVVLAESGKKREEEWANTLEDLGLLCLQEGEARKDPILWADFVRRLVETPSGDEAFAREVEIRGEIGDFSLVGRVDFVILRWTDGRPRLRLVECKSSRRDRVYHRIQATLYGIMVQDLLAASPLVIHGHTIGPHDLECVVARIDEDTNMVQPLLEIAPFPMIETLEGDIRRLLAVDGSLDRVLATPLEELPYQLDGKCDDCLFSVHCFSESARLRRLELMGLRPTTCRALRDLGVGTIDALAGLDPEDESSERLRNDPRLTESIEQLQTIAETRCSTLPDIGDDTPASFHVRALPYSGKGQLPEHEHNGVSLVRVYLTVSYDYVENRINGLASHVTRSPAKLLTPFEEDSEGKLRPSPLLRERQEVFDQLTQQKSVAIDRPLEEGVIQRVRVQSIPWTGRYELDNGAEMQLLQGFLRELVDDITEIADAERAPVHFYLWSRQEMKRLLEACSRVGAGLMRHIRELLGCRESLEQLIYSCLQDEVHSRFALGWTSRGLSVATSLRWFGQRFHWVRQVGHHSRTEDLERAFSRDVFDFRSTLPIRPDGQWAKSTDEPGATGHRFEVRGRNFDGLSAPYWRAYWRTLPDEADYKDRPDIRAALRDYKVGRKPKMLEAFLTTRTQALRWIDERIRFKNPNIYKPLMDLSSLPDFTLATRHVADAAIDFLKLDHHVRVHDWLHAHFVPPYVRLAKGQSLMIKDLRLVERTVPGKFKRDGSPKTETRVLADLDLGHANIDVAAMASRMSIGEGSFVRLTRRSMDQQDGQSFSDLLYGKTAVIKSLDWDNLTIEASIISSWKGAHYVLNSMRFDPDHEDERRHPYTHATVDASVSDFVADRIEGRLTDAPPDDPLLGRHVLRWFDPERPDIPPAQPADAGRAAAVRSFLADFRFGGGKHDISGHRIDVIMDGLDSRIQLLQGPPGTGKTMVTAFAVLSRILARHTHGDIILIAAHTHTAVDTLLARIIAQRDHFLASARASGVVAPAVEVAKVDTNQDEKRDGELHLLKAEACISRLNKLTKTGAVVVVGGTVNAILKMVDKGLNPKAHYKKLPSGFLTPLLVIDEASMMVFSHFLALASLTQSDGQIMLSGDHRQLSPIVAHDWDSEDRPPAVLYKPYVSAYEAILRLSEHRRIRQKSIVVHRLEKTWRLPPIIRELIRPLYSQDDIALTGPERDAAVSRPLTDDPWSVIWRSGHRLLLVLHDEQQSQQSNELEAQLIERILRAEPELPTNSVAVVTPHRAQRALLNSYLSRLDGDAVGIIDTVERLQGGERPTIFFSATVSDPVVISQTAEFILNLNRSNVAFSRTQERLIVVCARSLLDHIPAEVEHYESALLWKQLRSMCCVELYRDRIDGAQVLVQVPAT